MDGSFGQGQLHLRYTKLCARVRSVLAYVLRHVARGEKLEELIAECIAVGWKRFLSLAAAGKRPEDFPFVFASRLAKHVRRGTTLVRVKHDTEPLDAQRGRQGVKRHRDPSAGALASGPGTNPADLAASRLDYPAWLTQLSPTKRRVAELLAQGHPVFQVAAMLGLSAQRVSQIRGELVVDWNRFHGIAEV